MKLIHSIIITACIAMTGCWDNQSSKEPVQATNKQKQESQTDESSASLEGSKDNLITQDALPADAPSYNVVGFDYVPYLFQDEYGKSIGFEVDLLYAIGNEQGIRFNVTKVPYEKVLSSLENGSADLATSGLILTPERQEKFAHSDVHSLAKAGFMVKADSNLNTVEEISQVKISTIKDSPVHKGLLDNGIPEENIVFQPSVFLLFQSLFNGRAEASSGTQASLIYTAHQFPDKDLRFLPLPGQFNIVSYANKDNTDLINQINEGLAKIKASGQYEEINKKWFAEAASDLMVK